MKKIRYIALCAVFFAAACKTGKEVTASDFGDQWPLIVSSGRIDCISPNAAVFIHDGTTYQLNGAARSQGYAIIDPIWRDNPDIPGTKKTIWSLLQAALALC